MYTIAFHGHDHDEIISNFISFQGDSCYYKDFENSEMSFIRGFISSSWEIIIPTRNHSLFASVVGTTGSIVSVPVH